MNWFKLNILRRFKEKEPVKKEIPLYAKHIWGFLLETNKLFTPHRMNELLRVANIHVKNDGYFEYNKNLEIEFKSYE